MRSPHLRLALCLCLLAFAGCDKKKAYPTQTTGSILETHASPTAVILAQALTPAFRIG
jgi:hypothetical protein